jgi:hypothetical protein
MTSMVTGTPITCDLYVLVSVNIMAALTILFIGVALGLVAREVADWIIPLVNKYVFKE